MNGAHRMFGYVSLFMTATHGSEGCMLILVEKVAAEEYLRTLIRSYRQLS